MFGTVGWIGGPVAARGSMTLLIAISTAVVSIVVGALVYAWMQRFVGTFARPLVELERSLRAAASRRRDHIAFLRRVLVSGEGATVRSTDELHEAMGFFLRRVEERQLRQSAWIGALVHDVKTPVAAAATALSTVSHDVHTWTGQERELVRRVGVELRHLATHVQDLLDAVRLDREDVELRREDVDVAELVQQVVAVDRGVPAVTVRAEGHGYAFGDATLLRRAIENLVANAVRYARSSVTVAVFPGMVRITDDGPGLPADLDELAEPFRSETLDLGAIKVHGGAAGMGLFLARRVLELHDGKLVVERTGTDGTSFLAYLGNHAKGRRP